MIDDRRLSELMLVHKLLTPRQLQEARRRQEEDGGELYQILIEGEMVPEERALTVVADYLNIPCVSLRDFEADPQVVKALPAEMAARHRALPLGRERSQDGPRLYLAMLNPLDVGALEEIGDYTRCRVVAYLAGPLDLERALERAYGSAIYRVRSSLDALFGASVGASDPRESSQDRGPSVSQLLQMPILSPELSDDEEVMRQESLQNLHHGFGEPGPSSLSATQLSGARPNNPGSIFQEQPPTSPLSQSHLAGLSSEVYLEGDELDDLLEDSAASLLGEEFSLAEEIGAELFGVSASKIFVRPEALTDMGRKRLEETARQKRAAQHNSTQLGVFHAPEQSSSDDSHDPLSVTAPSLQRAERHLDLDASSVPAFRVPRELTNRSLRVLKARPASREQSLAALLAQTPDTLLLHALTHLLIDRELISVPELQATLELLRGED